MIFRDFPVNCSIVSTHATAVAQVMRDKSSNATVGNKQRLIYNPDLAGETNFLPKRPLPAVCSSLIKIAGVVEF